MAIIFGIAGYFLWQKPTMIIPYPYTINENYGDEEKAASKADILIVGDKMGRNLSLYTKPIEDDFSQTSKRKINIFNWSQNYEGLHRTLHKIKSLKKLPPLIIYHGGSAEWFENKFDPIDHDRILFNFHQFDNDKISSLIFTFPILSKIFYKKINQIKLSKFNLNTKYYTDTDFKKMEVSFKIYEYELNELIDYVKRNNSNIILITSPINAQIPPKMACPDSITNTIIEVQQEIENLLKEGNYKDAYTKALELSKGSISNAHTYFLLGISAKYNNEFQIARENLINANVYDCYNWRGNSVYNSIMLKKAKKFQIEVIDFATTILNTQLTSEEVFFDDFFPQNIFYNNLIQELNSVAKKYLFIKEANK